MVGESSKVYPMTANAPVENRRAQAVVGWVLENAPSLLEAVTCNGGFDPGGNPAE